MSDATPPSGGLRFVVEPEEFLALAGAHLGADPVVGTIVTSVAHRVIAQREAGTLVLPEPAWWLVVADDDGGVVGVAMRTAPFEPHPPYLLPMPGPAAVELARVLHGRGEEVLAVNGALPATRLFADEVVRLRGGRVEVAIHTRLFELGTLVPPSPVPGALRSARAADVDLVRDWWARFQDDSDAQGGRAPGTSAHDVPSEEEMRRRVEGGEVWLWDDDSGRPVSLVCATPPAFGVSRVGPVYTPPPERGRGWASNAVAEVSGRILGSGVRACLFTDQANPISNGIYLALGYRPVVDMANLVIHRG